MGKFEILLERLQQEIPGLRVIPKGQSWLMKTVFWFLANILRSKTDYSYFTTTIGRTIYVPDSFPTWSDDKKYMMLRHEVEHVRQFKSWPFPKLKDSWWWGINAVCMGFSYLFLPFPVLWTYRAKFEREGYTQTLLSRHELGLPIGETDIDWIIRTFTDTSYFYMAGKTETDLWVRQLIYDIQAGKIINYKDMV